MTPSYEQVEVIDDRLARLQEEVMMMEREYGFSKQFKVEQKENRVPRRQPKERYQNLPNIMEVDSKQLKMQPQLSNKWVEVFQEKPSIMQFYDDTFKPSLQSHYDIQIKPTVSRNQNIFEDFMDVYN